MFSAGMREYIGVSSSLLCMLDVILPYQRAEAEPLVGEERVDNIFARYALLGISHRKWRIFDFDSWIYIFWKERDISESCTRFKTLKKLICPMLEFEYCTVKSYTMICILLNNQIIWTYFSLVNDLFRYESGKSIISIHKKTKIYFFLVIIKIM